MQREWAPTPITGDALEEAPDSHKAPQNSGTGTDDESESEAPAPNVGDALDEAADSEEASQNIATGDESGSRGDQIEFHTEDVSEAQQVATDEIPQTVIVAGNHNDKMDVKPTTSLVALQSELFPVPELSASATEKGGKAAETQLMRDVRAAAPTLYIWTFGSGRWEVAVTRLMLQAQATHLFKKQYAYAKVPQDIMKDERWKKHRSYLGKRGYGYWFWKAVLTLRIMNNGMEEGAWLLYADAGCSMGNKLGNIESWRELTGVMREYDIIAFRIDHLEKKFTKGDIFKTFGTTFNSIGYGNAKQVCATTFLIANNFRTRQFVQMWVDLVANAHLLTDAPSRETNWKNFKENRHDQSLFSMMIKANQPTWPNPTLDKKDLRWGKHDPGWQPQPRHKQFGIPGLRILVLRDMTWPPKLDVQAISATRKASR